MEIYNSTACQVRKHKYNYIHRAASPVDTIVDDYAIWGM